MSHLLVMIDWFNWVNKTVGSFGCRLFFTFATFLFLYARIY